MSILEAALPLVLTALISLCCGWLAARWLFRRREPELSEPAPLMYGELRLDDFIAVLDQQPMPLFLRDNAGRVVFQNTAFTRLNDTRPRQLIEVTSDNGRIRRLQPGDLLAAEPGKAHDHWLASIDGHERRFYLVHFEVSRPGGALHIGALIDITETHQLRMQLQFSQRLETLGTLASGLAHDFNNLLTPILGYSSLLLDSDAIAAHRDKLQAIADAAHTARQVSRQLLAFTSGRPSTSQRERIDLATAATEVKRFLEATVAKRVSVIVDAEPDVAILIDGGELNQVLMNLATNAVQALGERGGELRFEIRLLRSGDERVPVRLRSAGSARISVADDGPGISNAVQKYMFQPFFTTKAPEEGSGLGLSVARNIIEQNQGIMRYAGHDGQGATFELFFPALRAPVRHQDGATVKVLLVETQPIAARTLRELVLSLGYSVSLSRTAVNALTQIRRDPEGFGLVVLGSLPEGTDAAQFRDQLHELRTDLPLLELANRGSRSGDRLPPAVAELEAAIDEALEHSAA
ncbi:MAG: ATP-binding protein [Pseudomonadota bacterium]